METVAATPPPPERRAILGIDPGRCTGVGLVEWAGNEITGVVVNTLRADDARESASQLVEVLLRTTRDLRDRGVVLAVAIEGCTWYGGSPGRTIGMTSGSYAVGFVHGVVQAFCSVTQSLMACAQPQSVVEHVRPAILRALGLSVNASKAVAAERTRLLIPNHLRKALDGASEHAYDAVAVALAADALRANSLASAKSRRGPR